MKATLLSLVFVFPLLACGGETNGSNGDNTPELPQIYAESPICRLAYVGTAVNDSGIIDVALRNDGKKRLQVDEVRFVEDEQHVFSAEIGGTSGAYLNESVIVRITFRPTDPGWTRARLLVKSNAENSPELLIPILALAKPENPEEAYTPPAKPVQASDLGELCP